MTEALASDLNKEIDRYREVMKPAIILIPGISGNTGAGIAGVKKSVEQAVGSDMIILLTRRDREAITFVSRMGGMRYSC